MSFQRLICRVLGHARFHDYGTHQQVCGYCGHRDERDTDRGFCTTCGQNIVPLALAEAASIQEQPPTDFDG
jgi:predicted amidophosphoribosyltransferase